MTKVDELKMELEVREYAEKLIEELDLDENLDDVSLTSFKDRDGQNHFVFVEKDRYESEKVHYADVYDGFYANRKISKAVREKGIFKVFHADDKEFKFSEVTLFSIYRNSGWKKKLQIIAEMVSIFF